MTEEKCEHSRLKKDCPLCKMEEATKEMANICMPEPSG